jgi:hypothetical protein
VTELGDELGGGDARTTSPRDPADGTDSSSGWIRARPFRSHRRAGRESRNDSRAGAGDSDAPTVSRLEQASWASLFPAGSSLIAGPSFPVPGPREIPPKVAGDRAFSDPRRAAIPSNPAEFPVFSLRIKELSPRDGFAPDCPDRHSVRSSQSLSGWSAEGREESRDVAGFWRLRPRVYEPETGGFEAGRRRGPRFSLLASWAVRFRSRFASAKDEAQQASTESSNPTPSDI